MDGEERRRKIWKSLKKGLSFARMGCCGSTWQMRVSDLIAQEEEEAEAQADIFLSEDEEQPILAHIPPSRGMTLAMALAAKRHLRSVKSTAQLKTLTTLFEATDGVDEKIGKGSNEGGTDQLCRVCLKRNKGAALIPCGHVYCRACSRELQLNRKLCPLCNRKIKEILNIF